MPERTCIGCRARRAQVDMLRFRRRDDGDIVPSTIDRRRRGRSAYLCPSRACLSQARKRRAFPRAFARSGAVRLDPQADAVWEVLWSAAADELRSELELLARTTPEPATHPRRRRLEALLDNLSADGLEAGSAVTEGGPNHG
ncbi:YlxR family protein [Pseudenhygromyxa sp. WMMC2535]|uniref:YlxR family protein n=1 Tax=Pseudenhygromyxa sp. WMMC2535 TaxID=2712867 RepID=UPI001557A752|nr:YlxR family protein [Pseudenhygromyxa sp. WMMC2535]NVB41569.1 YlxR family protein [Pseudenhygromyxa sp. WMMC2535]